ncbi:MAG: gliding motility-associated C-terminal domain-containing protein [Cytophagaceae bacterium]|nr:gliding motility-associated C-terminal domain-containing protein [Cytophagaceae bacterium]
MKKKKDRLVFAVVSALYSILLPLSNAQNLVPNPSFENLNYAPYYTSGSYIDFQNTVKDWKCPNYGTTDILSTRVDEYSIVALPQTEAFDPFFPQRDQMPRTGEVVAGIKPLRDARREYLKVKLNCPMIAGQEYYAEMFVSLADQCNRAQNNLGMYFTEQDEFEESFTMISRLPQIKESAIISDSISWTKISGTFTAQGNYQYLIIGNFDTQANTQVLDLGKNNSMDFPYYLVDDILVELRSDPTIVISGDPTLCVGSNIQLTAIGAPGIQWWDASGKQIAPSFTLNFVVQQSATVWARANYCGRILEKSEFITAFPIPVFSLGPDTILCATTSIILQAPAGVTTRSWQNSFTDEQFTVVTPGLYSLMVTSSDGCRYYDEIKISSVTNPTLELGSPIVSCKPNVSIKIPSNPYWKALWNNGSEAFELEIQSPGRYWLDIQDVCSNKVSDTLEVIIPRFYSPNLITPNGDDWNEYFEVTTTPVIPLDIQIFNSYGALVYTNSKYQNDWNASGLSGGIYFYQYQYPSCTAETGWVHVVK